MAAQLFESERSTLDKTGSSTRPSFADSAVVGAVIYFFALLPSLAVAAVVFFNTITLNWVGPLNYDDPRISAGSNLLSAIGVWCILVLPFVSFALGKKLAGRRNKY